MGTPELAVGVRNEGSLLWRHFPQPLVSELQATSPTQTLLSFLPTVTPNHPNRKGQGDRGRELVPTLSGVLSRCNFMGASVYTSIKRDLQCLPLVVVSCPRSHSEAVRAQDQLSSRSLSQTVITLPPRGLRSAWG